MPRYSPQRFVVGSKNLPFENLVTKLVVSSVLVTDVVFVLLINTPAVLQSILEVHAFSNRMRC
jgi:hypothetical protein